MSLLGGITKIAKSVLKIGAGVASGGIAGGILTAATGLMSGAAKKTATVLPGAGAVMLPALQSTAGKLVAGGAAVAAGEYLYDKMGNVVGKKHRRRRKGITPKDLSSFKRVARLIDKFSKPVHHFRNIKKG